MLVWSGHPSAVAHIARSTAWLKSDAQLPTKTAQRRASSSSARISTSARDDELA